MTVLVLAVPYSSAPATSPLPARPPAAAVRRSARSLRSFWISPREHPDFAWAWITRFLVNLGNASRTLYLLFYLTDGLGFSTDDATGRLVLLVRAVRRDDGGDHRASSATGATGSAGARSS